MTDPEPPPTATKEHARTDMPKGSWVDRWMPGRSRPYLKLMRLDRPIGTWLLLWPAVWSIALAGDGRLDWGLIGLFAIGALVMRGAGCTYNDIVDRDFDAKVSRTAVRPIPAGDVTVHQALVFLAAQLAVGLTVLLQLNGLTIALGVASLGLVFTYPFMKRITYWPQAWLGLTFNWGALMGWTAVTGSFAWPALALYGAGIAWTLGYDTIYAHQDKEDDALIGVKSSALALGAQTVPFLALMYTLTLALLGLAAGLAGFSWPFLVLLALTGMHFAWQVGTLDTDDPANCLERFKSNRDAGLLIALAMTLV